MASTSKEGGGSFRQLRDRHLPLFDYDKHRHGRRRTHPPQEKSGAKAPERPWKTVGIFHFRHADDEEG